MEGRLDRRGFLLWYMTAFCLVTLPGLWAVMLAKELLRDPSLLERFRPVAPHMGLIGATVWVSLTALWLWTKSAV